MEYNDRPSYSVSQYREWSGSAWEFSNKAMIYEHLDGKSFYQFTVDAKCNALEELLKRGIPYEDAKNLIPDIQKIINPA